MIDSLYTYAASDFDQIVSADVNRCKKAGPSILDGLFEYDDELIACKPTRVSGGPEMGSVQRCCWCSGLNLVDESEGIRCLDCDRLAWILNDESLVRGDWQDLPSVKFDCLEIY